jgi:hypothetical protein
VFQNESNKMRVTQRGIAVLKSQFVLDCPVLLSYNLGYSSTSSNNRDLGLFLGAGMGAHYLQNSGHPETSRMVTQKRTFSSFL